MALLIALTAGAIWLLCALACGIILGRAIHFSQSPSVFAWTDEDDALLSRYLDVRERR